MDSLSKKWAEQDARRAKALALDAAYTHKFAKLVGDRRMDGWHRDYWTMFVSRDEHFMDNCHHILDQRNDCAKTARIIMTALQARGVSALLHSRDGAGAAELYARVYTAGWGKLIDRANAESVTRNAERRAKLSVTKPMALAA